LFQFTPGAALAAQHPGIKDATTTAMNDLKALINYIEAQTNKKIAPAAAADLIAPSERDHRPPQPVTAGNFEKNVP
jgi:hypothetical protein